MRDHFRVVHSAYSRLGPCEKVPLPFEPDAEPVEFAFLCELEKKGKLTHEFPRCREAVNIRHLLNGIDEAHFDIFLSFSGTDRGLVKATHRELLANGIRAWIDDENLEGGSLWAIHIPDAIAKSRCIAVFIGPEGIRSWGKEEYLLAVTEAVVNGKTVIPVRLPGSVRMEGLPAEFGFLKQRQCIDFSDGVSECGIAQLIKAILNS